MRAYAIRRYGDVDDLRVQQLEPPECGEDQVLVRVRGAALNPGDWKVLTGRGGGKFLHSAKFPIALGFDFSGEVERAGPRAGDVGVGDEVFGFLPYARKNRQGSFGELVSVPADSVGTKPAETSHVEAACAATTGSSALQALRDKAGLASGERVLIHGASGGVGSYAVQIAKHLGAEVWGTCSASKIEYVQGLGADHMVDYREMPIGAIDARFDVVLDAVSKSSLGECRRILAPAGRYVTLLPSPSLLTDMIRAAFSKRRCKLLIVRSRRADLNFLAGLMADGALQHPIDRAYPLDELVVAFKRLRSGEARGKIGIVVG